MLATTRFTPQLIEHIQEQGLVLLSPNLDDVAYSIGHLVEQVGTGLLINVFNSPGHATKSSTSLPQTATGQEVNGRESAEGVHEAEHERFALQCGLQRMQLDLPNTAEPPNRRNDPTGLLMKVAAARPKVAEAVLQARQRGKRPYLWAPMGVGWHVNHQAVHQVVRELAQQWVPHFRLGFYEDLPYAHHPWQRATSLSRFSLQWNNAGLRRHVHHCTWASKSPLLSIYSSQWQPKNPPAYRFRPAALWPLGLHEALWMRPQDLPFKSPACSAA